MSDYPREATGREIAAWRKELIDEFRALAKAKIDDAAFATEIARLDAKMDVFNRIRLLPTAIDAPAEI